MAHRQHHTAHRGETRLDQQPDVYLSSATVWEVAIKQSIGKIIEPAHLPEIIKDAGFRHLPITAAHAVVAGRLPLIHRDPFDRMLIAQARCEGLTLTTRDPQIHKYDVVARLTMVPGRRQPMQPLSDFAPGTEGMPRSKTWAFTVEVLVAYSHTRTGR